MALETYRAKRDFKKTREPDGQELARRAGVAPSNRARFVVQKHDATRLHYDFRLEIDGVFKSWAVTKGPSPDPHDKRLAVEVEDHPLAYGDFEGTIPKGQYGGGTVQLWDRGYWELEGDKPVEQALADGDLKITLDGERLHGSWVLVRMKNDRLRGGSSRNGTKRNNWLLIKHRDEYAEEGGAEALLAKDRSVASGRAMDTIAAGKGKAPKPFMTKAEAPAKADAVWDSNKGEAAEGKAIEERATRAPKPRQGRAGGGLPGFIEPALASLVGKAPSGRSWLHEVKFDGYRLQARIEDGAAHLLTRTGLDWTGRFGAAVIEALAALPAETAILDGELVVDRADGVSDFSALQADLSAGRDDRFIYYAFDLLYLDGEDLRASKLTARKARLEKLLAGTDPARLRLSEGFEVEGEQMLRHACRLSLEGVVSKRKDAPYHSGRGKDWVKSKCALRQEFVIGGFVPSTTSRDAIGSLALGHFDKGRLIHVGRVGTGFSATVSRDLYQRLDGMRRSESPFFGKLDAEARRGVRYVEPELVAEIEFRAWTADHHLRHAAFRGLREDKPAEDVVREDAASEEAGTESKPVPKSQVKLSHPDRVYWPDAGVTKAGLADYYTQVWPLMAPFVVGRPLALLRCPDGATEECFFQKHVWQGAAKAIRTTADPKGGQGQLIVIEGLDGLMGLVQAGVLEIHPWGSSFAALEQPDLIIMDLDPGEDVAWDRVIAAAREVRERLEAAGLAAFVKNSGGKGLHVVAPLEPKADWEAVKAFTKGVADAMAADSPDAFVSTITKAKRKGKILLDYLRNGRGNTAVAPYSTRARAGAPVSMPLAWGELAPEIGPAHFTVLNAINRLSKLEADPWADFRKAAVPLEAKGRKQRS